MAFFITFEGIEGSGKTTQIRHLAEFLEERGHVVLLTREPGGCPIADDIRQILLHPDNTAMVPRAELLLYAAARAQHVAEVIRPALAEGKTVLCDRYTDATLAYQGYARGLSKALILDLNDIACDGLTPDLTLLLDMQVEDGLRRARTRNAGSDAPPEGRFELESLAFHARVREGYLAIARDQARVHTIDASGDAQAVSRRITTTIAETLNLVLPA